MPRPTLAHLILTLMADQDNTGTDDANAPVTKRLSLYGEVAAAGSAPASQLDLHA